MQHPYTPYTPPCNYIYLLHLCSLSLSLHLQYNFLMQYDYLPKSDLETGALRTEEQLIDAIRNLQVGVPAKQMLPHRCSQCYCHMYYAQFHN